MELTPSNIRDDFLQSLDDLYVDGRGRLVLGDRVLAASVEEGIELMDLMRTHIEGMSGTGVQWPSEFVDLMRKPK